MKLNLLPFLFLVLLLVLAQCAERRQGGRHVQGGLHVQGGMEKRGFMQKLMKKVSRKKSKGSKSRLSKIEPIHLEENKDWQYNPVWQQPSTQTSDGNMPDAQGTRRDSQRARARIPDEDPRKDWEKWNNKDNANSGSRRGGLPKHWDKWDDYEAPSRPSIGKTPKHWEKWINKRER